MDIKSWKIMLAVDDYGSFTRVGAELGYTQSGITQTMKIWKKRPDFLFILRIITESSSQTKPNHLFRQSAPC